MTESLANNDVKTMSGKPIGAIAPETLKARLKRSLQA
jgi:hypothetical protein